MSEVSLCGPPFERETQLPVEDALRISREVADALGCAHSRGGILKPANILLEEGHAVVGTVEPPNIIGRRTVVTGQVAAALERVPSKTPADRFG